MIFFAHNIINPVSRVSQIHQPEPEPEEPEQENPVQEDGEYGLDFDYFVDATNGSDSNNGISPETAWQTINKVNTSTFSAGDKIGLIANGKWEEVLTIPSSGESNNPITFGAYGTGAKPVIYGSKVISGWTHHSGNIYYATLEDDNIYQVFQNNVPLQSARYPNSGYHTITGLTSQTVFSSTGLDAGKNYAGCTIILRDSPWSLQTKTINSSSGQTLTINSSTAYSLSTGKGFFLYGHLDFLTGAGQWYLDKSANRLYVRTTNGTSPSNFTIRYSKDTNNIVASSKNHVKIENLDLRHANDEGVLLSGCSYITIDNCNVEYSTARCINFAGSSSYHIISNNSIKGAAEYGIYTRGSNHLINDNVVEDILKDIGIYGTGWGLYGSAIAVEVGSNNTVRYNHVRNVGYHGISYFDAPYTTIEYNYVLNAGITKDDCGGIYCYESSTAGEDSDNSVIRYNIVKNVTGIKDGTVYNFVQGAGIYLDERISKQTIEHNIVIGAGFAGIYLHLNNQECVVDNNTYFKCGYGFVLAKGNNGANNSIQNNTFYNPLNTSGRGDSNPVLAGMKVSDAASATINYNNYYDRYRATPFRQTEGAYSYMNFTNWKSTMSVDANSTMVSSALNEGEVEVLLYNTESTEQVQDLSGHTWKDLEGNVVTELVLQPFASKILIRT